MYRLALFVLPVALFAQSSPLSLAEAIESTLREHPLLHVQEQQVEYNRGAVLHAQSQFDRVVTADASHSRSYLPLSSVETTLYGASNAITNITTGDAAITQQFRNGITAGSMLNVTRTSDNVFNLSSQNQSHLDFQINIPLLRGRGRDVVTAQEVSNNIEVEASLLDLNQMISDLLFNTATSYWSTVAARRSLDVYREAETRAKLLLDTAQALIEADKIARADASEAQANLADRTASRIAAEEQLLEAKQQLAVAMGLGAEKMITGREATDPLPVGTAAVQLPENLQAAISEALTRRADYLATKKRQTEADVLTVAAKNQLKPQVDLQFSTGYSGVKDGLRPDQYFLSTIDGVHGLDASGGIRYQFPLQNRAAEGGVVQARSAALQAAYRTQDSARNIASAVIVAESSVRSAALQLGKVNESVALFRTSLDNEREKFRLGVGSLVDVLTVEDRLTDVLVQQVQAELGYAVAVARLRSSTGTIVEPDKAVQRVDPSVFLTLPGR